MTGTINPTLPEAGEPNSTADPKVLGSLKTLRDEINALLDSSNKIPATSLATGVGQTKWYTPKIIATEESRSNTAFGTLTTADEIKEVVVPTNGKLIINYRAKVKSSVAGAGRVALFLGATAIAGPTNATLEGKTEGTAFGTLRTEGNALSFAEAISITDVTTGFVIGSALEVSVAAGTYVVSAQYKASSGSVTAKERKLWVCAIGA